MNKKRIIIWNKKVLINGSSVQWNFGNFPTTASIDFISLGGCR